MPFIIVMLDGYAKNGQRMDILRCVQISVEIRTQKTP